MDGEDALLTWVPRLRRYARALAGNKEDADDLVQDTLERAWTRSAAWARVNDMRAWLFGIMHNVHVDAIRKPGPHSVPLDDQTPDVVIAPTQGDRLAVVDLAAALNQLPTEQKEVLLLVAMEEMSYAEVADALSIPIGTVMSRLHRGRERLRVIMDGRTSQPHLKVVK